jgi:hypothetical protein
MISRSMDEASSRSGRHTAGCSIINASVMTEAFANSPRLHDIGATLAESYWAQFATPVGLGFKVTLTALPRCHPKGGPTLSFVIGDFAPPMTYSDICKMPFATMTTWHTLVPGTPTMMRVRITITAPLAWLWGLVVGRKHASGLPAQTERLLAGARQRQSTSIVRT